MFGLILFVVILLVVLVIYRWRFRARWKKWEKLSDAPAPVLFKLDELDEEDKLTTRFIPEMFDAQIDEFMSNSKTRLR